MAGPDAVLPNPNLPSGYIQSEVLHESVAIGQDILPWLDDPYEVSISRCDVGDGTNFLLASVVGSDKRLRGAAEAMTADQRGNTDNMFYSRIAAFVQHGQATGVDTIPKPSTEFPIHVMRNNGGQRVYFGTADLQVEKGKPAQRVILRLAACDKNKQGQVMKVLSSASEREQRNKMRKSK